MKSVINIGDMPCSNTHPLMLFGGMNVLESRELAFEIAEVYVEVCGKLQIPYVFKASFDKANRSSSRSFRGPGIERGLTWLSDIKSRFNVPLITDVHEPDQAQVAAEICEVWPDILRVDPTKVSTNMKTYSGCFGVDDAIGMVKRNPNLVAVATTGYGSAEASCAKGGGKDMMTMSYVIAFTRPIGKPLLTILSLCLLKAAVFGPGIPNF